MITQNYLGILQEMPWEFVGKRRLEGGGCMGRVYILLNMLAVLKTGSHS